MVLSNKDLEEALQRQTVTLQKQLDDGITAIKEEVTKALMVDNAKLRKRVDGLEHRITQLENQLENNLQYQREANVLISGIPSEVLHKDLEFIVLSIFNTVCFHSIIARDIVACHRISTKSSTVVVKFLNKKDAIALIDSKMAVSTLVNKNIQGLSHDKIYVSEHLTPYMSGLAYRCRCLKRENKILSTKTQKGVVKILCNINGSLIWNNINSIDDLRKAIPGYDVVVENGTFIE